MKVTLNLQAESSQINIITGDSAPSFNYDLFQAAYAKNLAKI
jgi:hypothetical protein